MVICLPVESTKTKVCGAKTAIGLLPAG